MELLLKLHEGNKLEPNCRDGRDSEKAFSFNVIRVNISK